MVKGNMLKKLAEKLSANGIATYRYDKRSSKYIKERNPAVHTLVFDVFIDDAKASIDYFKAKNSFSKIYVIGHSQGSLVGMVAGKDRADGFISIAGPGVTIDKTLIDQINQSAPMFTEDAKRIFEILKNGETTDDFPAALASVFNKDIQPFIMKWMQYNPQEEIKKLNIPILITNGTNDIQVKEADADLLHNAVPNSKLAIIENMNHALVIYKDKDRLGNMKSYNEVNRELSKELLDALIEFIK
jgi:alpha-beta hydrolase superfamily lysophospholipase